MELNSYGFKSDHLKHKRQENSRILVGDKLDFFSFHASGRYYAFLLAVIVSVSLSYITLNSFPIDNLSIY